MNNYMKLIQIKDTHMIPHGIVLNGIKSSERLEACIASIIEHHEDAELRIISSDLTDCGDREAYRDLHEIQF